MVSDLVLAAVALMQSSPDIEAFRALHRAFGDSGCDGGNAALTGALSAILTAAGITPAALGPDMVEQLVAWSKATSRDEVIATMQRAAA
jgi:hypothetical protein